MAKISVTLDGAILQEVPISKVKISIGRRPSNDVVLNNLAISGEHAVIETHQNDSFLEDLNSTNGTLVNGQPIKRHFLQSGDVIELGKYRLKFESEAKHHSASTTNQAPVPVQSNFAVIKVMNGSNAGKQLVLSKELTSLGSPGIQVAVITRNNNAYFISHAEGDRHPLINDVPLGKDARQLAHGDVIDLSGTRLMFSGG